jgi:hypothetical protein
MQALPAIPAAALHVSTQGRQILTTNGVDDCFSGF